MQRAAMSGKSKCLGLESFFFFFFKSIPFLSLIACLPVDYKQGITSRALQAGHISRFILHATEAVKLRPRSLRAVRSTSAKARGFLMSCSERRQQTLNRHATVI